jgi:hypothetical protein
MSPALARAESENLSQRNQLLSAWNPLLIHGLSRIVLPGTVQ